MSASETVDGVRIEWVEWVDPPDARLFAEALMAMERLHRMEVARLTGLILACRARLEEAGLEPPSDEAGELALNQFHRLRNALEACYLYFDGEVPLMLRPFFSGTILT